MQILSYNENQTILKTVLERDLKAVNFLKRRWQWISYLIRSGVEHSFCDVVKEKERDYFKQCLANASLLPWLSFEEDKILSTLKCSGKYALELETPLLKEIFLWHFAESYSANMEQRIQSIVDGSNLKRRLEFKIKILQAQCSRYQEEIRLLQSRKEMNKAISSHVSKSNIIFPLNYSSLEVEYSRRP